MEQRSAERKGLHESTRLLWALVASTVLAGGLTLWAQHSISKTTHEILEAIPSSGPPVFVEVRAPRQEPAVYRLPPDATLATLFAAIGLERPSDQARRVRSGEAIEVSEDGSISFGRMDAAKLLALGLRIPLNTAQIEDLTVLPGIGERLAQKIVDYRIKAGAIGSYEELAWVPGVGPSILETLRRHTSL